MKSKIKYLAILLVGIAVGIGSTVLVVRETVYRAWQDAYVVNAFDQAHIALLLRADGQATVSKWIESELPTYALAIHNDFRSSAHATEALWMIKAFYDINGVPIPDNIKRIFEALPPQPPKACLLKLQSLKKTATTPPNGSKDDVK
jgi:hypothetical protein